jgi:hypothetical protein
MKYPLASTFNLQLTPGLAARPGSYGTICGRGQNLRNQGSAKCGCSGCAPLGRMKQLAEKCNLSEWAVHG